MKQPSGNAGEGPVPGRPVRAAAGRLDRAARPGRPGAAARYRLRTLWRLIATRGLRGGEGCGLRRPDIDLAARIIALREQITSSAGSSCP
jgi:integrase